MTRRSPVHCLRPCLLAAVLCSIFGASQLAACGGGGGTSEIIEFCTPIMTDVSMPPEACTVLMPGDLPPLASQVSRFLLATEVPITTVDVATFAAATGDSTDNLSLRFASDTVLAVVDAISMAADDPVVGRALFSGFSFLVQPIPALGPGGGTRQYEGLLGGDLLRRYAVRICYEPDPQCVLPWVDPQQRFSTITFIQEVSDSDRELSADGFSVIRFGLAGGGTMVLNDKAVNFGATRVPVGACLGARPFDPLQFYPAELDPPDATAIPVSNMEQLHELIPESGASLFLLVATGTFPLILGRGAFERLLSRSESPPATTPSSFFLMEGEVEADRTEIPWLALTGNASSDLSPCGELARRRRIAWIRYWGMDQKDGTWRLDEKGASVARISSPIATYVIEDTTDLFQGIRFEMTPGSPQIDGMVGHDFLKHYEMVLDYPEGRLIMRCASCFQPDLQTEICPPMETLDASSMSCCDTSRCICPSSAPCCQLPITDRP